MKNLGVRRHFARGLRFLAIGFCLSSCVDNDYDLSKDVDLTMGLGSDGLSMKLGTTEKIFLEDILEVDETIKLDENNLYYLVENGSSDVNFKIGEFKAKIHESTLQTDNRVIDYNDVKNSKKSSIDGSIPVEKHFNIEGEGKGTTDDFSLSIKNAGDDIISISEIGTKKGTKIQIFMDLIQPEQVKFKIKSIPQLKITLPDYVVAEQVSEGVLDDKTITMFNVTPIEGKPLCEVYIRHLDLGKDGVLHDHTINIPKERNRITMDGVFSFEAIENFNMTEEDFADIQLYISTSNSEGVAGEVSIDKVTGKFDPKINPDTEKIEIASSLPDFLQDEQVEIKVSNPTIKIKTDMSQIPLQLDFSGTLNAIKSGHTDFPKSIRIPEEGSVHLNKNSYNLLYFYQQGLPYDPVQIAKDATLYPVSNISDLIETLPDYINVDLGNQQIRVGQEEGAIALEENYHAQLDYEIFVPFEFEKGLKIIYKDSTNSLNDDLEDFQAEGMNICAHVLSTIPLELTAEIVPVDIHGEKIASIQVLPSTIPASDGHTEKESDFSVDLLLEHPEDLQKVDRLLFKIHAEGVQSSGAVALTSNQYMLLKDIRLKLKGQIIGNFN